MIYIHSAHSQVNGFEVYDPEEAVLLFLEQDQDITLTVARRIKVSYYPVTVLTVLSIIQSPTPPAAGPSPPGQHFLKGSKSHASLLPSRARVEEGRLRRTDSCGSLDSHCTETKRPVQPQATRSQSPTKPTRSHSPSKSTRPHSPSKLNHRRQLSDTNRVVVHRRMSPSVSSGYSTGENPSIITDHDPVFVPRAGRGHSSSRHALKVSTSVGSADQNSCRQLFPPQQRSIGSLGDWPRSPPASWLPAAAASSPPYRCNPGEVVTHVVKNESLV